MSETGLIWRVEIHQKAEKTLQRLPKNLIRRIWADIHALARNPRPEGSIKLEGYENLYRIRTGDWQISYAIDDDRLIVLVLEVAPRGGAYRNL